MADSIKSLNRVKPNHFIFHVQTNVLSWNAPREEIAKTIIDLYSELKSEKFDVSISSIMVRADKPELNKKGSEVRKSKKGKKRPNRSLHLNRNGANLLRRSFTLYIS